jgi:hypothetical protein
MSTRLLPEVFDVSHFQENPAQQYLGTIAGCPLLWDDQARGPYWPEGEPEVVTYEAGWGIQIDPLCDVNQLPRWVRQPKSLDCGHEVRGGEIYLTWLSGQRDECVSCAQGDRR